MLEEELCLSENMVYTCVIWTMAVKVCEEKETH